MGVLELLICALVATTLGGLPILFLLERKRRRQAFDGPQCGHCGYNLTGAPGNRCPECGKLFIDAGVVTPSVRSVPLSHVLLVFFVTFGVLLVGSMVFRAMFVVRGPAARPVPAVRAPVPSPPTSSPVRPVMTKPIPQSQAAPSTRPAEPITRE